MTCCLVSAPGGREADGVPDHTGELQHVAGLSHPSHPLSDQRSGWSALAGFPGKLHTSSSSSSFLLLAQSQRQSVLFPSTASSSARVSVVSRLFAVVMIQHAVCKFNINMSREACVGFVYLCTALSYSILHSVGCSLISLCRTVKFILSSIMYGKQLSLLYDDEPLFPFVSCSWHAAHYRHIIRK